MTNILDKIKAYKLEEIAAAKAARPYAQVEEDAEQAQATMPVHGFAAALRHTDENGGVALIAEVKKASPSRGVIRADFDPAEIALAYKQGGATCLSVLTDAPSFQGAPEYLTQARTAADLPTLRKDFIYDTYQVAQARALGADAILLIMASLTDQQTSELASAAENFNMDVLFEVHTQEELHRALAHNPTLLGINNRDLNTFTTDLGTTHALLPYVADSILCISESGISSPTDIRSLKEAGIAGFLVGESLMRQQNISSATRDFTLALSAE